AACRCCLPLMTPTNTIPCHYQGPSTIGGSTTLGEVSQITLDDDACSTFWKDYIAERKPCVVRGGGKEYIKLMSNAAMMRVAGDEVVTAEERKDESDSFGKTDWSDDKRLHIPFKDFIKRVSTSKVYMTTQDIPISQNDGGPTEKMGPHIQKLIDNNLIPLNPPMLKDTNLTQYQVNMWFGHAKDGSTTGLHHDYHDNVYMLLRGRKVFRIYSPDAIAKGLDTNGVAALNDTVVVLPNGLICYDCRPLSGGGYSVREDGARQADVV
ncbi:inositol hexakisphosphate kinase 3, partial [Perkinsus olseni]